MRVSGDESVKADLIEPITRSLGALRGGNAQDLEDKRSTIEDRKL